MREILVRGGTVVSLDPSIGTLTDANIHIRDGRIAAIGAAVSAPTAEIVDVRGCVVLPGFVDAHRHTWQAAFRYGFVDATFSEYGAGMLRRLAPHYRPEDVYIGTLAGALAALDGGTTTLLDWAHVMNSPEHADAAIAALRDSGLRAVFAYGYPRTDPNWTVDSKLEHPSDIKRVRHGVLANDGALVTLAMAARGPEMTTLDVTRADLLLARELGIRISMHVGAADLGRHRAVAALGELGLLGPDLTLIHLSSTSDNELAMIASTGTSACLGPWSETAIPGTGGMPIGRLIAAGITPCLSGDTEVLGPADMLTQIKIAMSGARSQLSALGIEKTSVSALDALRWATSVGADACGLGSVCGTLSVGKQADLACLRVTDLNLLGAGDPAMAVLGAHSGNIDTVIVNGIILKSGGQLVNVNTRSIAERLQESHRFLTGAAGMVGA